MTKEFDLTILIPAKDEQERLPPFLKDVLAFSQNRSVEVIVIDDGSRDQTSEIVKNLQLNHSPLKLLQLPENRGKGYALKSGMFLAEGNIVAFLDADGSTPVTEIDRYMKEFERDVDIVIGSRVLTDSSTHVQALSYRRWIGAAFNWMVHTFLMEDIYDTQCGFKMFRHEVINDIFTRLKLDGFGFDLEVLYLAKALGMKIKEVPVNWRHVDGSKVHLIKDSWRMLCNIFQIRSWHPLPLKNDLSSRPLATPETLQLSEESSL